MTLPPLTYITVDSVLEGAGHTQVLPYLAGLAELGLRIELHSFETAQIAETTLEQIASLGINWSPHRFGRSGPRGGVERLLRGAALSRRAELVHARGTLPAASAYLGRAHSWLWDMRGFWTDARIAVGTVRPGSLVERTLRRLEEHVAKSADAIVVLSDRARNELGQRYGRAVASKARTIPTCTDLSRFSFVELPPYPPYRLLFSGSLSPRYDLPTMISFAKALGAHGKVELTALVPQTSPRLAELRASDAFVLHPSQTEIPGQVARSHAGLCVLAPSPADVASMPTKVGEFLATGRPVIVSPGIGDLDRLLSDYACGVVIGSPEHDAVRAGARQFAEMLTDQELPSRCRALATKYFDVATAVQKLFDIYTEIVPR
jgi:glycosyltransferase involved in cell wall biosynthesis